MKLKLSQKLLDFVITPFLIIFVLFSAWYWVSPMSLLNPSFPVFLESDLILSNKFEMKNFESVYSFSDMSYETSFHVNDISQILPNSSGRLQVTGFSTRYNLILFKDTNQAQKTLQQSYQEYVELEGEPPYHITNIPIADFSSKADHYLMWCIQYINDSIFSAEDVDTCFYWATYGSYFSKVTVNLWPIGGGGRQFSLKLFQEIITSIENNILSTIIRN